MTRANRIVERASTRSDTVILTAIRPSQNGRGSQILGARMDSGLMAGAASCGERERLRPGELRDPSAHGAVLPDG